MVLLGDPALGHLDTELGQLTERILAGVVLEPHRRRLGSAAGGMSRNPRGVGDDGAPARERPGQATLDGDVVVDRRLDVHPAPAVGPIGELGHERGQLVECSAPKSERPLVDRHGVDGSGDTFGGVSIVGRALTASAAVLLVAAACSDGKGAETASDATPGPTAEPTPEPPTPEPPTPEPTQEPPTPEAPTPEPTQEPDSVECTAGTAPRVADQTIDVGGIERSYRLTVPSSYDGMTPMPVVLDFHGFSSSGTQQAQMSGFAELAEQEDFIAVHPQGTGDLPFWDLGLEGAFVVDDVGFIDALLDRLEEDLCVDPARIFSTGMSNGGYFSARLACDLADRIAAIASVAAVFHPDDCAPERPIPVLAIHGTDDTIVPYAGGESTLTGEDGLFEDAEIEQTDASRELLGQAIPDEVEEWAMTNGCGAEHERVDVTEHVAAERWAPCDGDSEVVFYTVDGGGHTWPGSDALVGFEQFVGPTTFEIDATALIWEFFQSHPTTGR